eukprot:98224-Pyramimonas_sp.AAC.1
MPCAVFPRLMTAWSLYTELKGPELPKESSSSCNIWPTTGSVKTRLSTVRAASMKLGLKVSLLDESRTDVKKYWDSLGADVSLLVFTSRACFSLMTICTLWRTVHAARSPAS